MAHERFQKNKSSKHGCRGGLWAVEVEPKAVDVATPSAVQGHVVAVDCRRTAFSISLSTVSVDKRRGAASSQTV